ncbi:hypothetical protein PMAYCL1PPCAC_23159 [Pristionchus mayeri]|uniref:Uncharacterized protein n=1 Tax=Pristionchus mayeri TaxID=1317129 RepID=A0AAN5I659_9BILA|nr:hypothetical protein PMAYCL1PPCAC_23159 [Pristionchus mayeri]
MSQKCQVLFFVPVVISDIDTFLIDASECRSRCFEDVMPKLDTVNSCKWEILPGSRMVDTLKDDVYMRFAYGSHECGVYNFVFSTSSMSTNVTVGGELDSNASITVSTHEIDSCLTSCVPCKIPDEDDVIRRFTINRLGEKDESVAVRITYPACAESITLIRTFKQEVPIFNQISENRTEIVLIHNGKFLSAVVSH